METTKNAAELAAGAVPSRLVFPADQLQPAAETIFITAGQIEHELWPGQVRLFADLLAMATEKGFQDADILRSLMRRRADSDLVRELVREVIDIMGGPGDFLDAVDLITWPHDGVRHD